MLTIRLSRVGKKKAPVYRIVVMPKHRDPWANNVEILGHYNPRTTPKEFVVKADRVKHWISNGAQPSDSVWNLLVEYKIVEGEKRSVTHLTAARTKKLGDKVKADEEAKVKAVEAAKAKAEAELAEKEAAKEAAKAAAEAEKEAAKAATEAPVVEEAPAEAVAEVTETPAE